MGRPWELLAPKSSAQVFGSSPWSGAGYRVLRGEVCKGELHTDDNGFVAVTYVALTGEPGTVVECCCGFGIEGHTARSRWIVDDNGIWRPVLGHWWHHISEMWSYADGQSADTFVAEFAADIIPPAYARHRRYAGQDAAVKAAAMIVAARHWRVADARRQAKRVWVDGGKFYAEWRSGRISELCVV